MRRLLPKLVGFPGRLMLRLLEIFLLVHLLKSLLKFLLGFDLDFLLGTELRVVLSSYFVGRWIHNLQLIGYLD